MASTRRIEMRTIVEHCYVRRKRMGRELGIEEDTGFSKEIQHTTCTSMLMLHRLNVLVDDT